MEARLFDKVERQQLSTNGEGVRESRSISAVRARTGSRFPFWRVITAKQSRWWMVNYA
jgi:hypothetical protein